MDNENKNPGGCFVGAVCVFLFFMLYIPIQRVERRLKAIEKANTATICSETKAN